MEYGKELAEISKLIASMTLLDEIRRAVSDVTNESIVTDGKHSVEGGKYDVVVRCGGVDVPVVSRRIKGKVADVKIKRISDSMLGVNMSRRTMKKG